jgi:hypothetical protein
VTVSIRIEPETGMAIASCSGILRTGDARDHAVAVWQTPGWSGDAILWDFRDAQFDLSSSDVRDIALFILERQPQKPPARVAFVTPRDVDFGLARVFGAFREDSRSEFRVFRDYDEALCWTRSLEAGAA